MIQGCFWSLIRSRIRPFRWCQNQRTWMTLNGRYVPYCTEHLSYGAHHENLNEDRPTLSAAKNVAKWLLSGNMRFMRTFVRIIPWEGASKVSRVVDNGNFQRFRWLFLGKLCSLHGFLVIQIISFFAIHAIVARTGLQRAHMPLKTTHYLLLLHIHYYACLSLNDRCYRE